MEFHDHEDLKKSGTTSSKKNVSPEQKCALHELVHSEIWIAYTFKQVRTIEEKGSVYSAQEFGRLTMVASTKKEAYASIWSAAVAATSAADMKFVVMGEWKEAAADAESLNQKHRWIGLKAAQQRLKIWWR